MVNVYPVIYNKHTAHADLRPVVGTATLFKIANSSVNRIITAPTFRDYWTRFQMNNLHVNNAEFLAFNPDDLEITDENILNGMPTFATECTTEIRFNAWVTGQVIPRMGINIIGN